MLRTICDFYQYKHDRNLGKNAHGGGQRRWARSTEKRHSHCNRQFKEVGRADHAGGRGNIIGQFQQSTGKLCEEEDQESLQNKRHSNEDDVQRIV